MCSYFLVCLGFCEFQAPLAPTILPDPESGAPVQRRRRVGRKSVKDWYRVDARFVLSRFKVGRRLMKGWYTVGRSLIMRPLCQVCLVGILPVFR